MKTSTLSIAAVGLPLILTGSTSADFTGITTASTPNKYGIRVCSVYAEFDQLGDHFLVSAGTPANPLNILVIDGTFYQSDFPFGSDKAPNPFFFQFDAQLRYDTFVTIGVRSFNPNDPGVPEGSLVDDSFMKPGWPGFGVSTLAFTDNAWVITPDDAQGDPYDAGTIPGDGKVLIGQFSTLDGAGIEGTMVIAYLVGGAYEESVVSFQHTFAEPCPWDCDSGESTDGAVGITDFLALLAQWGEPGSCDFDGGGVGINDFLELLANWGPCP